MAEAYQRELTPLTAAGWTVSVVLAIGILLSVIGGAEASGLDLMTLGLSVALAHFAIAFAAVRVHAPEGALRIIFGIGQPRWLDGLLGTVATVGVVPLLEWIDTLLKQRFPPSAKDALEGAALFANATTGQRAKIAVVMIVLLPVAQELFFRGLVFTGLAARAGGSTLEAGIVSTIAFALTSGSPREIVQMAMLGALLACIRAWSASSIVSTVAHASFFVLPIVPLMQGKAYDASLAFSKVQMIAMAVAALVALVVLRLRARASLMSS